MDNFGLSIFCVYFPHEQHQKYPFHTIPRDVFPEAVRFCGLPGVSQLGSFPYILLSPLKHAHFLPPVWITVKVDPLVFPGCRCHSFCFEVLVLATDFDRWGAWDRRVQHCTGSEEQMGLERSLTDPFLVLRLLWGLDLYCLHSLSCSSGNSTVSLEPLLPLLSPWCLHLTSLSYTLKPSSGSHCAVPPCWHACCLGKGTQATIYYFKTSYAISRSLLLCS